MKVSDFYRSEGNDLWLRHTDLTGPTNFTIASIEEATHKDGKRQMVLFFANHSKKLGLNVTNARKIASLLGDESEAWIGRTITLYVDHDIQMVDGSIGPGIRVVPVLPGNAPRTAQRPPSNGGFPTPPHVQGIVQRQKRQAPPPPEPSYGDGPGEEYDPLS